MENSLEFVNAHRMLEGIGIPLQNTIGLIAVMLAFGRLYSWETILTIALIFATLLQYSLFNHYSIMMRNLGSGDTTSRVDETVKPVAYPWERQSSVNFFHALYIAVSYTHLTLPTKG